MAIDLEARFSADNTPFSDRRGAFQYMREIATQLPDVVIETMARPAFFAGAQVGAQYIRAASRAGPTSFKNKTGRLRRSIVARRGTKRYPDTATIRVGGLRRRAPHAPLIEYGHEVVRPYNKLYTWRERRILGRDLASRPHRTGIMVRGRHFVRVGLVRGTNAIIEETARVMMNQEPTALREVRARAVREVGAGG